MLAPEDDYGNIEYKLQILPYSKHRFHQLSTQLKWRLNEGNGIAEYYLGVYDDGKIGNIAKDILKKSIYNIKRICNVINASIRNVETVCTDDGSWYKILIRDNIEKSKEHRILFLGSSQCGKTTLISNLTNETVDDGNGTSRTMVFNHKHEIFTGITSSVSVEQIEITKKKVKNVYYLIDTPGHKKYLKTTVSAIARMKPQLIFICVDTNDINKDEIQFYYKLCKFYNIPTKILLMKADKQVNEKIINDILDVKLSYLKINNLINDYDKLLASFKKIKDESPKPSNGIDFKSIINDSTNNITLQTCNIIKIPNYGSILVALSKKKIDIKKEYYLSNMTYDNEKIYFDSVFYLDKSIEKLRDSRLLTIKLKKNNLIYDKSEIISDEPIPSYKKLIVTCAEKLKCYSGIIICNNQYLTVQINNIINDDNAYKYELTSKNKFINISDKIILKLHDMFYFCKLIDMII